MTDNKLWKMVEIIDQLKENMDDINEYLEQVNETHIAFNQWIQSATDSIMTIQKDITFLKNKKTCI